MSLLGVSTMPMMLLPAPSLSALDGRRAVDLEILLSYLHVYRRCGIVQYGPSTRRGQPIRRRVAQQETGAGGTVGVPCILGVGPYSSGGPAGIALPPLRSETAGLETCLRHGYNDNVGMHMVLSQHHVHLPRHLPCHLPRYVHLPRWQWPPGAYCP